MGETTPSRIPAEGPPPMTACANCGSHVSFDYVRVFADQMGRVTGCPACEASPVAFG